MGDAAGVDCRSRTRIATIVGVGVWGVVAVGAAPVAVGGAAAGGADWHAAMRNAATTKPQGMRVVPQRAIRRMLAHMASVSSKPSPEPQAGWFHRL